MVHTVNHRRSQRSLALAALSLAVSLPQIAAAQASPFMTGATALQTNILAWLTPIAVILIMALGAMAMANRMIFRCSGSENGGTSQFAARLIGEREIVRRQLSHGSDREQGLSVRGGRRSLQVSEQHATELAVMPSELEQLPDLCGYLKLAGSPSWRRVSLQR
jgi:type IV secretory pathway VirB2 component (pilin)